MTAYGERMGTWEDRMAARAARGPLILDRDTAWRIAEEQASRDRAEQAERARRSAADDYRSWIGTCDVCEQTIMLVHSYTADGVIDTGANESGIYTWIRHVDGPQPNCRVYSSRVYQVPQ